MKMEDIESREMLGKSVFHSVDSVLHILKSERVNSSTEVQMLLKLFNTEFPEGIVNASSIGAKKSFVVFEGLDGSGKSTIARGVAKTVRGFRMSTPPKSMASLRKYFDICSSDIRRAYYSLGNYIAAKEIQAICQSKSVFLDRFWHSTAAYAIAQEFDGKDVSALPPLGDAVYKWPKDLLKPDLVLFLEVNEETRKIRHARRVKVTEEEDQLTKNDSFRKLVLAAYERMDDVPVVRVDSSQSIQKTVFDCVSHIKKLQSVPNIRNS